MSGRKSGNILTDLPVSLPEERFDTLLSDGTVRLERIVSTGHATPDGEWYDQEQAEWVMVVTGAADLRFEDEAAPRRLVTGDHIFIPAHVRHRVDWTSDTEPTVWLALHLYPKGTDGSDA